VDYDFIQTMKMQMVEGRHLTGASSMTVQTTLSRKAASKFGFKNATADQELTNVATEGKIIGVVKDFNFGSLHSAIEPLILRIPRGPNQLGMPACCH